MNNVGHTFPFINISTWWRYDISKIRKKSAFGTKLLGGFFSKKKKNICVSVTKQSISVTGKVQSDCIIQRQKFDPAVVSMGAEG